MVARPQAALRLTGRHHDREFAYVITVFGPGGSNPVPCSVIPKIVVDFGDDPRSDDTIHYVGG